MKETNNLDELFKNGIGKEFPVDEKLWANMEAKIAAQPLARKFTWFNFNSILLIAILTLCAFIPTDTVKKISIENYSSDLVKKSPNNSNPKEPHNSAHKKATKHNFSKAINVKEASSLKKLGANQLEQNDVKSELTSTSTNQKKLENNVFTPSNSMSASAISTNSLQNINHLNLKTNNKATSNSDNNTRLYNEIVLSKNSNQNSKSTKFNQQRELDKLNYKFDYIPEFDLKPMTAITKLPSIYVLSDYYTEVEINIGFNSKKELSDLTDEAKIFKNENEMSISTNSMGVNLFKQKKNFIYGVGISYSKFTEKAKYTVPTESLIHSSRLDTTYNVVSSTFTSNGVPVILIKQNVNEIFISNLTIVDKEQISLNKIQRIQIPLFIDFKQDIKNWRIDIRTAVALNYITRKKGIYVADDFVSPLSFNEGDNFNSILLSNKNQLGLGYAINEFMILGARYGYEADLNSYTKNFESKLRNHQVGFYIQLKP